MGATTRFLPLLEGDKYAYDGVATPASSTATACWLSEEIRGLLATLDHRSSQGCYDQLLMLADLTQFPHTGTHKMEWKAIKQVAKTYDVDITDWLLAKTLTPNIKPKRKAIYARAVVLMLEWVLSGEQGSLSRYLKDWGLNVNLAGVAVSEYRRYVYD